jgi:ubiquinone/menaquinone biosynthesis C-methylase UbiE
LSEEVNTYNPETYWSEVAERIQERGDGNVVAGDDSPYYRYKRKRFLAMLNSIAFANKKVMEIGHGPGGNLAEVLKHKPETLTGVDISDNMIALAKENLSSEHINFYKTDGVTIGYPDQSHDIVFSATVLQHNSDEEMMKAMFTEMLRVSSDKVIIFERIEKVLKGDELCVGRPVAYYEEVANKCGFKLTDASFINIQVSYLVCGVIRKVFNPGSRKEGEKLNGFSVFMQKATLPITKQLDKIFTVKRDLGKLVFERIR